MVLIKTISRLHAIPLDKFPGGHPTTVRKLEFLYEELLGSTSHTQAVWEHSGDRPRGRGVWCGMDSSAPDLDLGATPPCGRSGPGHETAHKIVEGHRRLVPIEVAQFTGQLGRIRSPGVRLGLRGQCATFESGQHVEHPLRSSFCKAYP